MTWGGWGRFKQAWRSFKRTGIARGVSKLVTKTRSNLARRSPTTNAPKRSKHSGMRRPKMNSLLLVSLLTIGIMNSVACQTKPAPSGPRDERGCFIGMLPPWEVAAAQSWAPGAKPWDVLYNSSCYDQDMNERLYDIYRRTHTEGQ